MVMDAELAVGAVVEAIGVDVIVGLITCVLVAVEVAPLSARRLLPSIWSEGRDLSTAPAEREPRAPAGMTASAAIVARRAATFLTDVSFL
jgi:hypothetical protein